MESNIYIYSQQRHVFECLSCTSIKLYLSLVRQVFVVNVDIQELQSCPSNMKLIDARECILYFAISVRRVQVITDLDRQDKLIEEAHGSNKQSMLQQAKSGHWGRDKMLQLLSVRYIFPWMKKRIQRVIKVCPGCQFNNPNNPKAGSTLQPINIKGRAWDRVGIDLIGKLHNSRGFQYICTAVDYFTKWVEAEPLHSKDTVEVAAFLHKLQCRYGISRIQMTDQGGEFNSDVLKEYFKLTGIQHRVSAAYHPQSNGMVERQNRCIEDVIRKVMSKKEDWLPLLDSVLFACRVTRNSSTKFTPYFMVFQREATLPLQWTDAILHGEDGDCDEEDAMGNEMNFEETLQNISQQREKVFAKAKQNIDSAQQTQAKYYNARNEGVRFFPGDKVLKLNQKTIGRKEKFLQKYIGPYVVIGVTKHGSYYLKDRHGKDMKRPVPPQQVKRFFKGFEKIPFDAKGNILWCQIHDIVCYSCPSTLVRQLLSVNSCPSSISLLTSRYFCPSNSLIIDANECYDCRSR